MPSRQTIIAFLALCGAADASVKDVPLASDVEISVDGVISEAVWADALRVDLTYENNPGENNAAPVSTIGFIVEDGANLYVAFKASDPDPTKIQAWFRDRDSLGSNDFVGISLDTYDDGRRAFEFFANPLGVQLDRTNDDINNVKDASWNANWESAGKINTDGYVVEFRIPLDQLRFQNKDGPQVWRYRLTRSYPRFRNISMSNIPVDRNRNCSICQYARFEGFPNSTPGLNLEVTPTVTALNSRLHSEGGWEDAETSIDAGLTISYGITSEITANLALNPDFSQVEADSARLDINNRFALSFPERRPFFLEGLDFFRSPLEAVFTRTFSDPQLAAKVSGKTGANTYATILARDEETNLLFPGSNGSDTTRLAGGNTAWVGRFVNADDGRPSIGLLATVRDASAYQNLVGGLDSRWRLNDQQEIFAQWLRSDTEYPVEIAEEFDQPTSPFSGDAYRFKYAYDSRGWFSDIVLLGLDEGFRADAGFITQAGIQKQEYSFGRKLYAENAWWERITLRGAYEIKNRQDGQLLEDTYLLAFGVTGPLQTQVDFNVREGREFDGIQTFDYRRMTLDTRFEPIGGLRIGLRAEFGDEIDVSNFRSADRQRLSPSVNWSIGRHGVIQVNGRQVELKTKAGARIFDASLIDARLTWQFNLRSSLKLTVQESDVRRNPATYIQEVEPRTRQTGRQLLYSWKMNAQTVFFLGYSDEYATDDESSRYLASERNWFMKVGYGWNL